MKKLLTLLILCTFMNYAGGQIIFEEDFESGTTPAGWENQSNASDGGWKVGSAAALSSQFFPIQSNGSGNIAGTNDDACNCNKSDEIFITPPIDLSSVASAVLRFDSYYTDQSFQGAQEHASIVVSLDKMNWDELEDLHGHGSWDLHSVDLTNYVGNDSVYVGFMYDDVGAWLYGFAIDNVLVEVPLMTDAQLISDENAVFGEVNREFPIKGTLFNNGIVPITSINLSYTIDGGAPVSEFIDGLNIQALNYHSMETMVPWLPSAPGIYSIEVSIDMVNGMVDDDPLNNTVMFETEIFDEVIVPNKIDLFLAASPEISEIPGTGNLLNKPTDLDFFPILGKNELWVINERTESDGGSTLKVSNATEESPTLLHQVDGNAWHFMSLPTGIAFSSENFNFGTSPGVQDANHSGGTFTGPTLWSSDPEIYAQPSGGNGSHLDMLHGSPYGMGIAHEVDNVFWVFDDWNSDIVRYDFVDDHGPGNDDHSDAIVRRYSNIGIDSDRDIPSHMILDKNTGWLYVVDNENNRVFRLDINSGNIAGSIPLINEPLAEHSRVENFTVETILDTGLVTPCGIELFENYLLVGEYFTGDIAVFDMDNNFSELGRIETGEAGLTGIKIGPDGNIWYTNRLLNQLNKMEPGMNTGIEDLENENLITLSPNPTSGILHISYPQELNIEEFNYTIYSINGKQIQEKRQVESSNDLDLSTLNGGVYLVRIESENFTKMYKVLLQND